MNAARHCRDTQGVLSSEKRRLIETMLRNPDADTWQRARHIVINPSPWMTLGMAVSSVTPLRQVQVPDPFTVYRAIRYAINQ